jgi:putative phosphoribosyl transferase
VDEFIVLTTPAPFFAVGQHYQCFAQVDDAEVLEYLHAAQQARAVQMPH